MYSKQDLALRHEIVLTTVRSTLVACGLDTRNERYTEEEANKFAQARQMISDGANYAQVADHFGVQPQKLLNGAKPNTTSEDDNGAGSNSNDDSSSANMTTDPFLPVIEEQVQAYMQTAIDKAVERGMELFPYMLFKSIEKRIKQGSVTEINEKFRQAQLQYYNALPSPVEEVETPYFETGNGIESDGATAIDNTELEDLVDDDDDDEILGFDDD